VKWTSTTK